MDSDYMQILLNILIGYAVISMIFTTFFFIGLIRNIRREVNLINDVKQAKESLQIVYIEQTGDMYRMYDKLTNHFICQAQDELELWDLAKAKYPGKKIVTLNEDAEIK